MQATRQQILELLKRQGSATIEELARDLPVSSMCVRQHLLWLEVNGLVARSERRGGLGRPCHVYRLTDQGHAQFPNQYETLSHLLLDELRALDGSAKLTALAERIGRRLGSQQPALSGTLQERVAALTQQLAGQGRLVDWEPCDGHIAVHEYHCPFGAVARRNPELCAICRTSLAVALGTPVELAEQQALGAARCTYVVAPEPAATSLECESRSR